MAINSTGPLPGPGADEGKNSTHTNLSSSNVMTALSSISLRCVECSALYPAIEAGQPARYRCDCGGVLDVETTFKFPRKTNRPVPQHTDAVFFSSEPEGVPAAGAMWRQLFDERASNPPIWSISSDTLQLDYSGVWRYRELILPVPENYVVSRPEGNTGLYPVGIENCGQGRIGHRAIGAYAGLERLFLKQEVKGKKEKGGLRKKSKKKVV